MKKLFLFCGYLLLMLLSGQLIGQQKQQETGKTQIRIAQDYEHRGKYELALNIYKSLYEQVPNNLLYYEGVKRNMINLKKYGELVQIINHQIIRSNDVRYYADIGDVFFKMGQLNKALEVWKSALAQFNKDQSACVFIANSMTVNGLYDEAVEVYLSGRKRFTNDDIFIFELANIYVTQLKYREATLEYIKHLLKNPNQFDYIENRIISYTKENDQALKVAEVLSLHLQDHEQEYYLRKLLADLYLRIKEFGKALEQYKFLEKINKPENTAKDISGKELFFFATEVQKAEKYKYADEAYNMILTYYPLSPYKVRALYGLALIKQKRGLLTEALQQYEALISIDNKSAMAQEAQFQIGELYFKEKFELDKALISYQNFIKQFPQNDKVNQAYFRMGDCYLAKGDFDQAKLWYERSAHLLNSNTELYDQTIYKQAYLLFLLCEYDSSLKALNKIMEKIGSTHPNQDFVNDALELSFLIQENKEQSGEALKLYSAAQKLKLQNQYPLAADSLKNIVAIFSSAPIVELALMELGEIENQQGNYLLAINYFESLLTQHSESVYNVFAQKRIAEVYENKLIDAQKAYGAYEKILINYPESIYVEEARQKLRELHNQKVNN